MAENRSYPRRGGGHSRLIYIIRHAWYCMCDGNAWEWLRMYENQSYSGRGVGVILSWYAVHSIHENAPYYLIMNEHVCDENAWEWPRMCENHSYSGRCGVVQGGYTPDDIHENVWLYQHEWTCLCWECMRMTENGMHENDWGCVRIAHIQGGGGGHSMMIYIIRHAWYCMRMHENEWESPIFKDGVVVILGWYTLYDMNDTVCVIVMHENEWECMSITHTQGWVWVILSWYAIHDIHENALDYLIMNEHVCDENAWAWLRMCENYSYSGRGVGQSKLIYNTRHPWECIRLSHHEWRCLWWECMRMTENVWYSLLFREGCWSFNADIH